MHIALCDVGLGNLNSVERALARAAHDAGRPLTVARTSRPEDVARADAVVFPGQGGFGACAASLVSSGLAAAVGEKIRSGAPYVGICLGLQILFDTSEEAPEARGLSIFEGEVRKLVPRGGLKVPHIGWNQAEPTARSDARFAGSPWFYFVHSYVVVPRDASIVDARTTYGEAFVSAVAKDNVFACQFHPEKSQAAGLALLQRVLFS